MSAYTSPPPTQLTNLWVDGAPIGGGYGLRQSLLTSRMGWRMTCGASSSAPFSNTGVTGATLSLLCNLENTPSWIWFAYAQDINSTWAVTGASYALSGKPNDGFTPTNALGNTDAANHFRQITFNNAGTLTTPGNTTVPAVTNATVQAAGSGGTNGSGALLTVQGCFGGSNFQAPVLSCTISAGAVASVDSVSNAGSVTYMPPNPVSVLGPSSAGAGFGLTGATLNLTPGSLSGITVPANSGNIAVQNVIYSDPMPVGDLTNQALTRTDGGFGTLVMWRTYSTGNARYSAVSTSGGTIDPVIGRSFGGNFSSTHGNLTIPPYSNTGFGVVEGFVPGFGLAYQSAVRGLSVGNFGDSIMMSLQTAGQVSGVTMRACALISTSSLPVSQVNRGLPSASTNQYLGALYTDVAAGLINVAVIQGLSQEDIILYGSTMATAMQMWGRVVDAVDYCRAHGVPVIITTGAPVFGTDAASDAIWASMRKVILASGLPVLDIYSIWGNGLTPNGYKTGFNNGDGRHPNNTACAVAAPYLAQLLQQVGGLP